MRRVDRDEETRSSLDRSVRGGSLEHQALLLHVGESAFTRWQQTEVFDMVLAACNNTSWFNHAGSFSPCG